MVSVFVRGTFHQRSGNSLSRSGVSTRKPVGLVFLNSLSLPRAATGDSAVYWAESFANYGYPSFRLDLPGLGDTAGNIPTDVLSFINEGGYAPIAAAKMKELVEHFNLSGVVLVGHCAGTDLRLMRRPAWEKNAKVWCCWILTSTHHRRYDRGYGEA